MPAIVVLGDGDRGEAAASEQLSTGCPCTKSPSVSLAKNVNQFAAVAGVPQSSRRTGQVLVDPRVPRMLQVSSHGHGPPLVAPWAVKKPAGQWRRRRARCLGGRRRPAGAPR
eukprot:7846524-Pyramimonas_sp.AAC.1